MISAARTIGAAMLLIGCSSAPIASLPNSDPRGAPIVVRFGRPNSEADKAKGEPYLKEDFAVLMIGYRATDVRSLMGDPLPGVSRRTTASGTVEIWRYFGPVDFRNDVTLTFENGKLSAVDDDSGR